MSRYRFTERDCSRIEAWARKTNLHAILSFIETHPRKLEFPRPVLLGSNGNHDILVEGLATRSAVSSIIRRLNEPFNPHCPFTFTHVFQRQTQDLSAEIYGTIAERLSKGAGKLCFLQATGQCERGIVRSHLIQEALLREIAVNGHVLEFNLFGRRGPKEDFRNWPRPVGVDRVTTFTGFCAFHDHNVFRPIEDGVFAPTPEALFLYSYRALCSSLYTCQYRFEMVKATKSAVDATQPVQNRNLVRDIEANDLNTRELITIKAAWDRILARREFDACEHLVLSCPKTPDIVGAMFFAPTKDFSSEQVQNTRTDRALSWVAVSVLPRKDGGVVIISGQSGDAVWRNFANSLTAFPPERRTMALVNYMLCYFGEQIVLSPKWWDRLPVETQESVMNAWAAGYFPRHLKRLCDWGPLLPVSSAGVAAGG